MGRLKIILSILITFGLLLLVWVYVIPFFNSSSSFLKITTSKNRANVYLDDKLVGKTPYLGEKLRSGERDLLLETKLPSPFNKRVSFATNITLIPQALTAVNYEFGPNEMFSSGDIRSFRIGNGLTIISNPGSSDIWLDGENVGKSPVSIKPSRGIHKLKVSKNGFFAREIEINIEKGYRLILEVYLSYNPFGEIIQLGETAVELYYLSSDNKPLLNSPSLWAEGVYHFENKIEKDFDLLIDKGGKTYFKNKTATEEKLKNSLQIIVGYLGAKKETQLSTKADATLTNIKNQIGLKVEAPISQVEILSTPTGILNVRSGSGLSYSAVAKVKPGEKYELIEEKADWFKIRVSGIEGWISAQYAKRL